MADIAATKKEDSHTRSVRRAVALAILPVAAIVLVVLGSVAVETGLIKWGTDEGRRLGANSNGLAASVGRGSLGKDGYLLEVPAGGDVAVAVWTIVPSGLADFPLIRCDCLPGRVDAKLNIVWRRADQPKTTFSAPITHELGETELLDLSRNPDWTGEIIGIGLALRGLMLSKAESGN